MNQEPKRLWLEALRSGNYDQTTAELYVPGQGYCCLGVLTDVYAKQQGINVYKLNHDDYMNLIASYSYDKQNIFPSEAIRTWAGLDSASCTFLAEMNDNGETFEKLANYIEEKI